MSAASTSNGALREFIASAPFAQKAGMGLLLALERRPRGRALLARNGTIDQLAQMLTSLDRYDDRAVSRSLGWDAEAVVARGRALRATESRP